MVSVLFVCLGNICRSPMAEAIFRQKVKEAGLGQSITVDSAGTGDWHVGQPPHKGTRKLLKEKNIDASGLKGRQFKVNDFDTFDYIIGMDSENITNMKRLLRGEPQVFVGRLLDLVKDTHTDDVPDPYFTGNFEEVYDLVNAGCDALLEKITAEHHLLTRTDK